jgi:hypothetical protein
MPERSRYWLCHFPSAGHEIYVHPTNPAKVIMKLEKRSGVVCAGPFNEYRVQRAFNDAIKAFASENESKRPITHFSDDKS